MLTERGEAISAIVFVVLGILSIVSGVFILLGKGDCLLGPWRKSKREEFFEKHNIAKVRKFNFVFNMAGGVLCIFFAFINNTTYIVIGLHAYSFFLAACTVRRDRLLKEPFPAYYAGSRVYKRSIVIMIVNAFFVISLTVLRILL